MEKSLSDQVNFWLIELLWLGVINKRLDHKRNRRRDKNSIEVISLPLQLNNVSSANQEPFIFSFYKSQLAAKGDSVIKCSCAATIRRKGSRNQDILSGFVICSERVLSITCRTMQDALSDVATSVLAPNVTLEHSQFRATHQSMPSQSLYTLDLEYGAHVQNAHLETVLLSACASTKLSFGVKVLSGFTNDTQ